MPMFLVDFAVFLRSLDEITKKVLQGWVLTAPAQFQIAMTEGAGEGAGEPQL